MAMMALPSTAWGYSAVRFLQVLCAAPIFPLVVARTAQQGSGGAIGVINSARIGGSFIRPRARDVDPVGVVARRALRDAGARERGVRAPGVPA